MLSAFYLLKIPSKLEQCNQTYFRRYCEFGIYFYINRYSTGKLGEDVRQFFKTIFKKPLKQQQQKI